MRRIAISLVLGLGIVWLAGGVSAAITNANSHSWKVIVERNPFGLKPPAPPPKVEAPSPPAPKTEVTLTGIASMLGSTKAYLITKEQGKSDPKYVSLSAGEADGAVEVLEINEKAGTVKINNAGVPTLLNFKDNGIKTAAAAPAPNPNSALVMPGGRPMIALPPPNPNVSVPQPSTFLPGGALNPAGGTDPLRTIPLRPSRLPSTSQSQNTTVPHPPQPSMSAEESIIHMEILRETRGSELPPLPPTPLTTPATGSK